MVSAEIGRPRYDQVEFARDSRPLGKEKVPGSNPGVGSTSSPRLDFVAGGQTLTPRSSSLDAEAAAFRVIYGDRST